MDLLILFLMAYHIEEKYNILHDVKANKIFYFTFIIIMARAG